MDQDRIAECFRDQVLFLTGATGFMGKVFLERLLRTTEVKQIFVLIRPKRDKNSEERLLEILANPVSIFLALTPHKSRSHPPPPAALRLAQVPNAAAIDPRQGARHCR
jgi:hypothetical protein